MKKEKEAVEKKLVKGPLARAILILILAVLWSGCSDEEELPGSSQVKTTFQLENNSALGGSINIHQAFLKLESIAVSGARRGKNISGASHSVPADEPPYRLAESDSAQVTFTVRSRTYDLMDLHLSLFADEYKLVFTGQPMDHMPDPVDNTGAQDSDDGRQENPNQGDADEDVDNGEGRSGNEDPGTGAQGDDEGNDDGNYEGDDNSNGHDNGNDGDDNDREKANDHEKNRKDHEKKSKNKGNENKGKGGRRSGNADSQSVDLDHFFQNARPGVAIFGTWDHNGEHINIVFVVTDPEVITVRAIQNNSFRIVLDEQDSSIVSFDPEKWFEGISINDLQSASMLTYQGQPVIFVHKNFNTTLFEKLFSRFIQSAQFRFDDPGVQ